MDMACWGLIPRFWVKDKGFKEDDAVWGDQKTVAGDPPADATELREGAFVAKILCDDREEEMEENMEQVRTLRPIYHKLYLIPDNPLFTRSVPWSATFVTWPTT